MTTGTNHTSEALAIQREQLLEAMSGVSESRWCAGWLTGLEERLHAEGGIWKILGEQVGWPVGEYGQWTWVTWEHAKNLYFNGVDRPCP
jgi:hypothetical protein